MSCKKKMGLGWLVKSYQIEAYAENFAHSINEFNTKCYAQDNNHFLN